VALTPAGIALLPEARRMLAQAQELPQLVQRAAAGEVGRLTLAFVSSADYSVLPPFLRAYRAAYPQVQITLQEATSDLQLDDLLHNRIDAGLLIPPLPDKAAGTRLPAGAERTAGAGPAGLAALKKRQAARAPAAPAAHHLPARDLAGAA
jgi:DNA-binding transcriptional LysR family regulator